MSNHFHLVVETPRANRLRRKKTMTLGWIAQGSRMGTKTYLSHLLCWLGKEKKQKQCAIWRN